MPPSAVLAAVHAPPGRASGADYRLTDTGEATSMTSTADHISADLEEEVEFGCPEWAKGLDLRPAELSRDAGHPDASACSSWCLYGG